MCTGRSPFRAESTMAVLHRVGNDSPRPITEVNADIPVWLIAIIDRLLEKEAGARFQTAAEVADLLSQCLAHVQQPTVVPLPEPVTRSARNNGKATGRPKWYVGAILLVLVFGSLGLTEATGVTQFSASVISIVRGDGTLVVEVNDPQINVTIEGEDIVITGAGPKEVLLKPGEYRLQAHKDGKPMPLEQQLVSIKRGGRKVVNVTLKQDVANYQSNSAGAIKEVRRFKGHTAVVVDVAFSADGRLCLSGGNDQTLRFWNTQTGDAVNAIYVKDYVGAVALSSDGRYAASGDVSGRFFLWDVATGRSLHKFPRQTGKIHRLAFSSDGRMLASQASKSISLWDVDTHELRKEIEVRGDYASFDLSPDNKAIVSRAKKVLAARPGNRLARRLLRVLNDKMSIQDDQLLSLGQA